MSGIQGEIHVDNNHNYIVSGKLHENMFDFHAFVCFELYALFLIWVSHAVFNCLYMVWAGLEYRA